MNVTSAAGVISLLDEPKNELKSYALHKLYYLSDEFWPEISESIQKIEILYEENSFNDNKLAALVASKVYYHLGSYNDSVHYALRADDLFDVNVRSEYVDTIIAKCIDLYIKDQCDRFEHSYATTLLDQRLVSVVDRMIKRCFQDGQYKQALGLGLEARRMDIFRESIINSDDVSGMLAYALGITLSTVESSKFRDLILMELVQLYKDIEIPDYVNMSQCFIFLEQPDSVANILEELCKGTEEKNLMAYQIAFDMYESAPQKFLWRVIEALCVTAPVPAALDKPDVGLPVEEKPSNPAVIVTTTASVPSVAVLSSTIVGSSNAKPRVTEHASESRDVDMEETPAKKEKSEKSDKTEKTENTDKTEKSEQSDEDEELARFHSTEAYKRFLKIKERYDKELADKSTDHLTEEQIKHQDHVQKTIKILSGEVTIELQLQFLIRSNKTDMLVLKNTKDAIRVSICHTATVIANGFMHSGTTSDQFLRDNLEWLSRATNWAKLTATASLGVIHHGHEHEALALMQSYLPREAGPTSGYSEGGGLYALGLIHANHGAGINDYLIGQLKETQNEVVKHGGCLGLGLSAMGTNRSDIYHQLKFNLYQDDAVTGEAAALGMGLVMFGSKSYITVHDMIMYAQETQHEKILRGLAVAIALVMYGSLEGAESVTTALCQDKDQNLRRAGMFTLAMAFCGTGSNYAIRQLLHFAVSDVNDDVRRAAVISLGFLLFRTPEQCPSVVSLLAESYNAHVRYGAAMALGIACAGTGNKEAIALLDTMTNDSVNFVRQGALIASAMVLIQQTEGLCPKVKDFRALYAKVITDKHEDVMSKFGAILAQGIIDAGGKNVTISLETRAGHVNMKAIAGMLLFVQYWYWFPLAHCLALTFRPTCIIALNSQLKMPKVEFRSNARPSLFGYTPPLEEKKRDEREKVTTAVLSIAARAKKRSGAVKQIQQQSHSETKSAVAAATSVATATVSTAVSAATAIATAVSATVTEGATPTATTSSVPTTTMSELSVVTTTTTTTVEKMQVDDVKEGETALDKEKPVVKEKEKDKTKEKEKSKDKKKDADEKKSEPNFEILSNPARVMNQQLKHLQLTEESDYKPLKNVNHGGIILFHCTKPSEEQLVEPVAAFGPKPDDEKEAEPPAPFLYED